MTDCPKCDAKNRVATETSFGGAKAMMCLDCGHEVTAEEQAAAERADEAEED
jgi:Zn ribbon nucleic-acid-binding protein